MADVRHGLALFPGTEAEVGEAVERISRKCKDDACQLMVVMVGREVDGMEAEFMERTSRLPRRVQIRLAREMA